MKNRATVFFAIAGLVCLVPLTGHALTDYSQDFEGLIQSDPSALANDGWLVYGNVFTPDGDYIYGYGPFPAPNDGAAFCAIAVGQGGGEQGAQQLSVYSDYNNLDHANGNIIESNVFQEQLIGAADIGETYLLRFHAKMGNVEGSSTAAVFIKTLDPDAGYALTNFITADMTQIPTIWNFYSVEIVIDASLEGQILQFGFLNTATHYEGSGIFYDNVSFFRAEPTGVPAGSAAAGMMLHQNHPNPFNPKTTIEFALDWPGNVELAVFDVGGRRIATLQHGEMAAGDHTLTWDAKNQSGYPVAAGRYWYVLKTPSGQVSRSMTLLK